MKRIKFLSLLLFAFLLFGAFSYGHEYFQGGVNFSLGFPQNEFRNKVNRVGVSFFGHFTYHFRNSPFSAGLSLGYLVYGIERREELLSVSIPEVLVNVTTANNIFLGHFLLRVQPPEGKFRPYLDALIGINHFYTSTRVHSQRLSDNDTIARTIIFDDWALSYGAGGGLMIQVYSSHNSGAKGPFVISVDMSVRYLKGGRAEYLKEGSIRLENDQVLYNTDRSTTDLLNGFVGMSFSY